MFKSPSFLTNLSKYPPLYDSNNFIWITVFCPLIFSFLPIYIFDKYLKPISFIGQLTKPKGIKLLSAYVCLSSSSVFYINKTEIDSFNNLFTLFQKNVSEDVIKKLFEGHFLFQDTDIDFLSKNYSRYFYIQN